MPLMVGVPCAGPRCRVVVRGRRYCSACELRYGRPSARARGYDTVWARLRARHLVEHPFCQIDRGYGRGRCGEVAREVDHIVPVDVAPHRRLDPTNLQSTCASCHRRKTAADHREVRP